jgi:hypothetical protein
MPCSSSLDITTRIEWYYRKGENQPVLQKRWRFALIARCVWYYHTHLGKGGPLRASRCIPPGGGGSLDPFPMVTAAPRRSTVWPVHHQSGRVPAPRHPMTKGAFSAPLDTLDQPSAVLDAVKAFAP